MIETRPSICTTSCLRLHHIPVSFIATICPNGPFTSKATSLNLYVNKERIARVDTDLKEFFVLILRVDVLFLKIGLYKFLNK